MTAMKTTIRRMGNSRGVIIPKPVLAQLGLQDEAEMVVEKDCILLRRPEKRAREGWAEASQKIAAEREDKLVWPEFANEADVELQW